MGNCCLPIQFRRTSSAVNPKSVTLLLLGLDNSGKTTIAKRLAGEPIDSVVPTVGFSVILLPQRGCHVSLYDLGGGPQIRDIWPRYYADAHGIIFVTDAQDLGKMEECRRVLESLLQSDQISGKPVLLLANKQDLEGALDEIDVVDRLNLEKLVNEQKCPTLVELCSGLNFAKKMDVGIENGYKWLIRSIIREYPSLNNRVLRDLASQEEENKVQVIRRKTLREEPDEGTLVHAEVNPYIDPFKPVRRILDEQRHPNGVAKGRSMMAKIPGLVEEVPEKLKEKKTHIRRFLREEVVSVPESPPECNVNSYGSELDRFRSDLELLNEVPNHSFKNFLVRPKSSGARLYGVRSERKRTQRRKALRRGNKTGPAPFADVSDDRNGDIPKAFEAAGESSRDGAVRSPPATEDRLKDGRNVEGSEGNAIGASKSVPNSRRSSTSLGRNRRHSVANGRPGGEEGKASGARGPLRLTSPETILLDVRKLG